MGLYSVQLSKHSRYHSQILLHMFGTTDISNPGPLVLDPELLLLPQLTDQFRVTRRAPQSPGSCSSTRTKMKDQRHGREHTLHMVWAFDDIRLLVYLEHLHIVIVVLSQDILHMPETCQVCGPTLPLLPFCQPE
jgi:hypothetical protein